MKALVFGASGQVGRALAAEKPANVALVALDRAECDITSPALVRAKIETLHPDVIFNAAAYTAVDAAETHAGEARAINEIAVATLAAAASAAGARLIHISTDFVFDGAATRAYTTDAATNPLSVYGSTKLAGEKAAQAAAPDALIVRTAWVYAQQGKNFVATMLRLMGERDEVRVVADQIGTPTYAADLARALWRLTAQGAGGIYHYTNSGVASWFDFAVAIQDEAIQLGRLQRRVPVVPIATSEYPTPARRPAFSVLDCADTWALAGGPAPHWRHALRRMLEK